MRDFRIPVVISGLIGLSLVACGETAPAPKAASAQVTVHDELQSRRFGVTLFLAGEEEVVLMRGELVFGEWEAGARMSAASVLLPTPRGTTIASQTSAHSDADSVRSALQILSGLKVHRCASDGADGVLLTLLPEVVDNSVVMRLTRASGTWSGEWEHDTIAGPQAHGQVELTALAEEESWARLQTSKGQ